MTLKSLLAVVAMLWAATIFFSLPVRATNPIITEIFTADPAALVHGDTVYLYAGQDESTGNGYRMNRWVCYSSKDMKTWTSHGSPLAPKDFSWARGDEAWASQVIEKNGKFYWYVTVEHDATKRGKAIGVAVSDSPTGPFTDARGSAIITADMTPGGTGWEDIDPTVFTDSDGTTYLFWGNNNCYYAKLKPNMTELDGPIVPVELPWFTEAPWIHKRGNLYYLSYATYFPEKIAYATAPSLTGPWTYRGLLAEVAGNSNTIHQAIIEFKGQWYFIYHNGSLPGGGSFRRSVCVDYLYYNPDGTMRRVVQTTEGTSVPPLSPTTPEQSIVASWNRLQSFSNPNLFVRHADYKGVLAPTPIKPYMDSMWKAVPGLSNSQAISFESLNLPGHFLRRQESEVVLAKNDDSAAFKAGATFFRVPGLADASWSSFRSAEAPNSFLRQSSGTLRVEPIATETEKDSATFRLTQEGGAAPPPANSASTTSVTTSVATSPRLFGWRNPIVPQRADPHVTLQSDGTYYLAATVPEYDRIELRRARSLGELSTAEAKVVWRRPASGPMSGFIWAPELHRIDGKWYLYVAAGEAPSGWNIHMYVLENASADPFSENWVEKGKIQMNWNSFSLDATTFEHRGTRYLVWAQSPRRGSGTDLYIAKMNTPWSIEGEQVLISRPEHDWELRGRVRVNEAPAVLIRNGRIFMTYSASATDANYALGLLTADVAANLLDPNAWKKSPEPVLASSRENSQFGPGHNSFTTTPDGKTDILVYHARSYERIQGDPLRNPDRATRAQVVQWQADGTPFFGTPVADGPIVVVSDTVRP